MSGYTTGSLLPDNGFGRRRGRKRGRWRRLRPPAALLIFAAGSVIVSYWLLSERRAAEAAASRSDFDCVIVPGGGLDAAREPAPWVAERLEAALRHDHETASYLVLSRGTTHKPAPTDSRGYAVDEAAASALHLQAV